MTHHNVIPDSCIISLTVIETRGNRNWIYTDLHNSTRLTRSTTYLQLLMIIIQYMTSWHKLACKSQLSDMQRNTKWTQWSVLFARFVYRKFRHNSTQSTHSPRHISLPGMQSVVRSALSHVDNCLLPWIMTTDRPTDTGDKQYYQPLKNRSFGIYIWFYDQSDGW